MPPNKRGINITDPPTHSVSAQDWYESIIMRKQDKHHCWPRSDRIGGIHSVAWDLCQYWRWLCHRSISKKDSWTGWKGIREVIYEGREESGTEDKTLWNTRQGKAKRRMNTRYTNNLWSVGDVRVKPRKTRVTNSEVLEFGKQKVNSIKCFGDV